MRAYRWRYLSNHIGIGSKEEVPAGVDGIKPGLTGGNGGDELGMGGFRRVCVVHAHCFVGGDSLIHHEGEQNEEERSYNKTKQGRNL